MLEMYTSLSAYLELIMGIAYIDFAKCKTCFWTVFRFLSHSYYVVENVV